MKTKIILLLLLCSFSTRAFSQFHEMEREALYYLRKAKSHIDNGEGIAATKQLDRFETYLTKLSPEKCQDSTIIYYSAIASQLTARSLKDAYRYASSLQGKNYKECQCVMGLYPLFHEHKLREAERLLVLSAKQGYVNAQGWLGSFYLDGDFGSVDTEKAIHWFSQAAEQGSLIDAYTLAELYFDGEKIAENDREALRWYEFVANGLTNFEKYNNACIATASYYIYGAKGINVDFPKAKKYALKAFESGEKRLSSYYLGQLSTRGFGNRIDDFENCFKWMFISANEGHPKAQNMVGLSYECGFGVEENMQEAMRWYKKAEAQGDKDAQKNIVRTNAEEILHSLGR